jgi:DNA polymerase III subunit beta
MKVKCNRSGLYEALQLASSIVPARTPKPILQCAKIEATKDPQKLTVLATDNEISVKSSVSQVQVNEEGAMVIPADRLTAILREGADDTVDLESADAACQVIGKDSRFHIYGHDANDFPAITIADSLEEGWMEIQASSLRKMIHQVSFAAAKESTRYAINGVLWEPHGKKLRMVATDGRRLAQVEGPLAAAAKTAQAGAIIPLKTMGILDRILHDPDEVVRFYFTENHVGVSTAMAALSSTLVQGRFPKYSDVIPAAGDKKATFPVEAFSSAVRRAALLANEQSRGIQMEFSGEKLRLTSSTPEAGDAEINIPVTYEGGDLKISFNPTYLLDMTRVVEEPEVVFEFSDSTKPGVLRAGKDFLYVVMPVTG